MNGRLARLVAVFVFAVLAVAFTAGTVLAGPPGSFPGQGTDNASNTSHCHIVNPASSNDQAGFTIVNPSEHAGGHSHGAPFTATPC
jgi:hypothetical protein